MQQALFQYNIRDNCFMHNNHTSICTKLFPVHDIVMVNSDASAS